MSTALTLLLIVSLRADKVDFPKYYIGQFYGIGWVTRHKEDVVAEKYDSFAVRVTNDELTLSITRNSRTDMRVYDVKNIRQWGHDNKYLAELQQYSLAGGRRIDLGKYHLVISVTDDIMNILISGQEYKSMTLRVANDDFLELFTLRR
ncbi:MAG: hypothetical protein QM703_11995 [Gemmatales bacterium]